MKRLTKLKNQFNGKLRVSLLILLALQLFVPKLNAQINLTASPTPPTNDCLNPEVIEVENNFQSYEADLSNLNSYYLSFSANKSTLYLDVLGDEEGNLPQSLKLYEEECSETPIEQTYMQTDSNGVQSIELNYHNLNLGQNYIVEIVQNSAASVGNLTLFIRNFDPLDPPLEPIVPECDNFVYNGSFELENISRTNMSLNMRIHYSTGYLRINNGYSYNRGDYFHPKGSSSYSPPNTTMGNGIVPINSSLPNKGAFAGIFATNTGLDNDLYHPGEFREWICGQLDQSMEAGKQYEISYYVHLSNRQWYHDKCIPPGILFTSTPTTTMSQINIVQMVADIQPKKIISDTSDWHKITAYYTATGNEQYFTVANFLNNNESNNRSGRQVSYFFIDEIKVTESCCTALEIPDGWDVNDVLTSPNFGSVVSGSTLSGANVKVNGTFTVNSNFSINNVNFIMAEDAKIKVTNGSFDVLGSEFRTCSNVMWKGIEVDGGALTIDDSKVKDAIKGINSLNGSAFTVSNTTFDANYHGIYVDAYNGYHAGTVEGSTFDCSYSLKDATVGTNTLAGIYLNDVVNVSGSNNITIGSIYDENVFLGPNAFGNLPPTSSSSPGLQYGIIANKSSVNIYNNHFQSFIQLATIYPQKKSAIKIIGVPDIFYYSNNYVPKVSIGSTSSNRKNDFIKTTSAVKSEDIIDLTIMNNNIDFQNNQSAANQVDYAISILDNTYSNYSFSVKNDIKIVNNEIKSVVNGVFLSNCSRQESIEINSNTINLANTDVNGLSEDSQNAHYYSVDYNVIQGATEGITLINVEERPNINNNNININNNFSPAYGIRIISQGVNYADPGEVRKNTIKTQTATNNIQVYGISIEPVHNVPKIECNTIKRTGTAMHFAYGFTANFPAIFGNKMENNYNSFVLSNNADLWSVGMPGKPSDNEWINSTNYDTYTDGADGSYTTLYTRGGGLPYQPMSNGSSVQFQEININTSATGSLHNCDGGVVIGPGLMASSNNSLPDFESKYDSDTAIWIAKYHYYRSLPEDSLISNKSIQAFKDSMDLSPVGALMQIKSSANSYSSRRSQMMAISCNTIQEVKLKTAISYQLQAKNLNWDTLPTVVRSSLENIALECPYEAGPAVYEARNLLMRYTGKSYYNSCEGYTSTVASAKTSKRIKFNDEDETKVEESISIYPNPVKDELNINIQLQEDEVAEWTLQNIKGQLIQSGSLKSKNNPIDLSHLSQGIYFIQIKMNNQLIKTDKLIVQ